jgi:N-acetylmuramoyl-L-alanine amidase
VPARVRIETISATAWPRTVAILALIAIAVVATSSLAERAHGAEPAKAGAAVSEGNASAELRCLAVTVFHEARGETREGQAAVAHVIVNRRGRGEFPATICGVVKQGTEDGGSKCQFSAWCDGRAEENDPAELADSEAIARAVLAGETGDPTEGAQWFHAADVEPDWVKRLTATVRIGRHKFYRAADSDAAAK